MTGWIVLGVLAAALLFVILTYNKLIALRNQFKNAFAQIDVQLKRRYDLIPNLVETAKAFMAHERETLEAVISARNQALAAEQNVAGQADRPDAMKQLIQAESQLTSSMGRLLAVFENYPDIKSDQTMGRLMEELSSTENKISFARQHYNDSVMLYQNARESFPAVLFASTLGFQEAVPFEIAVAAEREPVQVQF